VRSVQQPAASPDDATARARIRDAAIRLFGARGFDVGVRAIAAEAGVSPALVLHHFGSKDGLREACDAQVLALVRDQKMDALQSVGPDVMLVQLAELEEYAPLVAYSLRSMLAGGELARALLEDYMAAARDFVAAGVAAGALKPSLDEEARIRFMAVSGLGALVAWTALDPPEDFEVLGPWLRRYIEANGLATVELYTQGLFTDRRMLDAYLSWVPDPPGDEASV